MAFSIISGITVFLLFLLCFRRGVIFRVFTLVTALTLICDTVFLIIYKETGLIESVPIIIAYIMLCTVNMLKEKEYAPR